MVSELLYLSATPSGISSASHITSLTGIRVTDKTRPFCKELHMNLLLFVLVHPAMLQPRTDAFIHTCSRYRVIVTGRKSESVAY